MNHGKDIETGIILIVVVFNGSFDKKPHPLSWNIFYKNGILL